MLQISMADLEALTEQSLRQTEESRILLGSQNRPDRFTVIGISHRAAIREIKARLEPKTKLPKPPISRRQNPGI